MVVQPADPCLLTILRRPTGLFALVVRRSAPFEPPLPALSTDAKPPAPARPYEEALLPLAQSPVPHLVRRKLLAAWKALQRVSVLKGEVTANVLAMLASTLPDPFASVRDVGPLELADPPARPAPTAAHPRAYQGTIYKPPKPRLPHARDLTAHLCAPANEARILARLAPFRDAALRQLAAHWPKALADTVRAHASSALRPYGQTWSREAAAHVPGLPPALRRYLLYSQRGRSWRQLTRLLELWWSLDLEHDADLRLCIALALTRSPEHGLDWCATAMQTPATRRVQFMELLLESGAYRQPLTPETAAHVAEADRLCMERVWRPRMYAVCQAVAAKHDLAYLLDGFRLANEFSEPWSFRVAGPRGTAAAIKPWAAHIAKAQSGGLVGVWAISLWGQCAEYDGLVDVLRRLPPGQLDPETAADFLPGLLQILEDEDETTRGAKWRWLASHAQHFFEALTVVRREYRAKLLRFQREFLWHFHVDDLRDLLPGFLSAAPRLCAPPFRVNGRSDCALAALLHLSSEQPRLLLDTRRATWGQLEAATFRRNDGLLIGPALHTLVEVAGPFTAAGWIRAPRAVLRTAKVLGSFHPAARSAFVRSFVTRPVCQLDPLATDWPAIWKCVRAEIDAGVPSPLPARLRAHLEGRRVLTPAQLNRDRTLLQSNWCAFQWEVFRRSALAELARGLNPPSPQGPAVEHALRMQPEAAGNRRALRELLRQRFAGRPDYALRHPLNRRWLAAHPQLNADLWTRGIALHAELADQGPVDLRLETDPLEVLRMGSYFGTCLGLGGIYTHSAIAVALDVNKQVVYARTPAGRVTARQLLAISEANELVCFNVYPAEANQAVRKLFRAYDQRFARRLGLPIHDGHDEHEYEIRTILSHDFWDDGPLDSPRHKSSQI